MPSLSGIRFTEDGGDGEGERRAEAAAAATATAEKEDAEEKEGGGGSLPTNRPNRTPLREWSRVLFVLAGSQPTRFRVVSLAPMRISVTGPTPRSARKSFLSFLQRAAAKSRRFAHTCAHRELTPREEIGAGSRGRASIAL